MMEKATHKSPSFKKIHGVWALFYEPIRWRRRDKSHQKEVSKPKRIVIGGWYAFTLP